MDNEEFEKRLNKEKSFITPKNHTAEFEKQLERQKEEYKVKERNYIKREPEEDILEDILTGSDSDDSSSGMVSLIAPFISIAVAVMLLLLVLVWFFPVIQDVSDEINVTEAGVVNMLPLMVGLVLFVVVASLLVKFKDY